MAEAVRLMIRDMFTGPTGLTPTTSPGGYWTRSGRRVLDHPQWRGTPAVDPLRGCARRLPARGGVLVTGRVAVVTGAASGIGFALARRFARDGDRVVLADLHADVLADAAGELEADSTEVLAVPTDVTDPDAVDLPAARTVEHFGTVHVVCNNAGLVVGGAAWEVPLTDWHRLMDVNLWGVIHGIRSFMPILHPHDEPANMVNTTSMAAVTTLAGLGPYVASKHTVLGLTETLFHDIEAAGAGDRIGVTVICPGYVPTRIGYEDRRAAVPDPSAGHRLRRRRGRPRWSRPWPSAACSCSPTRAPPSRCRGAGRGDRRGPGPRAEPLGGLPLPQHLERPVGVLVHVDLAVDHRDTVRSVSITNVARLTGVSRSRPA